MYGMSKSVSTEASSCFQIIGASSLIRAGGCAMSWQRTVAQLILTGLCCPASWTRLDSIVWMRFAHWHWGWVAHPIHQHCSRLDRLRDGCHGLDNLLKKPSSSQRVLS